MLCNPKNLNFSSVTGSAASDSVSYGGWEDLGLVSDSDQSGESSQLRNFLVSLGIDDRRYVFMFLLGLVCALAISRVRVSSVIVFPASVIVFAVGFSFGFVRKESVKDSSVSPNKRRSKTEIVRASTDKRNLLDFFDGFDVEVTNLKNDVKRALDNNHITVDELKNYIKVLESISLSTLQAKHVVDNIKFPGNVGESNGVVIENQKPSRRRKELAETGFDLLQFVGGLFGENLDGSMPSKMKDNLKRENTMENAVNGKNQGNIMAPAIEEEVLNSVSDYSGTANVGFSRDVLNNPSLDQDEVEYLGDGARRINILPENGHVSSFKIDRSARSLMETEDYSYQNNRLQFTNNLKMGRHNKFETWASQDTMLDSVDFSNSLKDMETEASFGKKHTLKRANEDYRPSHGWEKHENETYRSDFRKEREGLEDEHQSTDEKEVESSSSSVVSDDVVFDRYVTKANEFLKQARKCISSRGDGELAETILNNSANLLSKAIAMKPMSLLAVGLLGNTYLLHGELKLKISREMRTLLSRNSSASVDKRGKFFKGLDDQISSKDKVVSALINVCEECEELLVEAGRKYRMALSIDGNDVRALYNWGLALSFRAQLIADIGPEAASDADKVFLAAIDKFDAMMSKSNVYAPDALFRWGVVLQQRSRLRPNNSKEKVKLLQQAKRLYEDALNMDSDNLQVRETLLSCISELNFRRYV